MPMKRCISWPLLALMLLLGCGKTPSPGVQASPSPASTFTPAPTASPLPDKTALEAVLKQKTLVLHLEEDTDRYDLHTLGYRCRENGQTYLDEAAFSDFCDKLDNLYACEAKDAQALLTDDPQSPFLFELEEPGKRVDRTAFSALLLEGGGPVTVPFAKVAPAVTQARLKQEFTLLSSFTTSFKGDTLGKANRVKNIALAASRINGYVLEPEAVFSMNKTILDRNKKNGYYTAAAIRNGAYNQEYGGGVCQVSSTLFNAVLMADLEVVERYHHSWPMHYVPIGRDATIATGEKDFRFKNNTGSNVYIVARADTEQKTITIELYGVHSDDFAYIQVVSEQTGTLPKKGDQVQLDESLAPGQRNVQRKSRQGQTSTTYKEYYDETGSLLRRVLAFEDSYPSIGGITYVSPQEYYE